MITYVPDTLHIKVKWKRKEIGRIYTDTDVWWYIPRGCSMQYAAVRWDSLKALKQDLET